MMKTTTCSTCQPLLNAAIEIIQNRNQLEWGYVPQLGVMGYYWRKAYVGGDKIEDVISYIGRKTMSNDRYEEIRKALAMGPTPGPWLVCHTNSGTFVKSDGFGYLAEVRHCRTTQDVNADASFIAACDPDTIQALLDERDGLAAENEALREEVERLRTDGASAVRWAPGSAYWSEVLVELFGPDARKGIDVLETRWRKELERAERLAEALKEIHSRSSID